MLHSTDNPVFYSTRKTHYMKDVKDYKGIYAVTKKGEVWAYPRERSSTNGMWKKGSVDFFGYVYVTLYKNGIESKKKVHRLVAQAYIANPKLLPEVNHKNGIKTDNRVQNLEWCTSKQNHQHALKLGLYDAIIGVNNHAAKLTEENVREIKNNPKTYQQTFADKFGVNRWQIHAIRAGKTWKHIT